MSDIETLLAKKFIARRDVKAIQHLDGSWAPHTSTGKHDGPKLKWTMGDLRAHIAGTQSFGHYLLGEQNECKLFAFDIDFEKNKLDGPVERRFQGTWVDAEGGIHEFDARQAWLDRKHPSREFMKVNIMLAAHCLAYTIQEELELETAIAYSGGKGVHVYAFFPEPVPAADAREGATIVMETLAEFEPTRGDNFFRTIDQSAGNGMRNLTIELFPKQDTRGENGYGNLMRLPLGRNLKNPKDPTFFIDMSKGHHMMTPLDPIAALTTPQKFTSQNG